MVETPTEERMIIKRPCLVCGKEQARKKVWANGVGKRVICMACGQTHTFLSDGKTVRDR
jgi:hypothetical protein